jgi:hypothetical protein
MDKENVGLWDRLPVCMSVCCPPNQLLKQRVQMYDIQNGVHAVENYHDVNF